MDLIKEIGGGVSIAITGHIRPDGDSIGSAMALYQYLDKQREKLNLLKIDVFLEPIAKCFDFLKGTDNIIIINDKDSLNDFKEEIYDVFISLDCASLDRIVEARNIFDLAKKTINIDHHISNTNFADINYVIPDASSTAEVIYGLLDNDKITKEIAEALYIGIIHDTGVFRHTNTTKKTMNIAGDLMSRGIEFSTLIGETFFQKTYVQNQILGRVLMESQLVLGGKCIVSSLDTDIISLYNVTLSELDGIIDQMRQTRFVEIAIFLYEFEHNEYKVSMRSNFKVDVSRIAMHFGGGGHKKAAGCCMSGSSEEIIKKILELVKEQL
ncbi:MAG TPA: bifunctional oligoribonuclease/PAP phosphatase NrnA [Clostridiales bacterium]|nr:bifunctional oligoribonuclease/PAP phosphatase NrnA [Clostridiales bacterium]